MTESQLSYAIAEGLMVNDVQKFWTVEVIHEARRKKMCPTVVRLAWKKYVDSVKDQTAPPGCLENGEVIL